MARTPRTTNTPVTPSRPFWPRGRICNGRRRSWCTVSMLKALCAWWKSYAAPAGKPTTFLFIFWASDSRISGRDRRQKAGAKRKEQTAKGKEQGECPELFALLFLPKWWPGTESNRRRRPFQRRLPYLRSGLKSTVNFGTKGLVRFAF